ncbi:GDSL-type esterase/lipase family protein [Amycolatopsis nalaikhensis]|uniref:GDSL-type esterase/lipase family protein n=1 Tax=Amycolatopsis nalaikhensis TaxID=715472 RepID=A0ABY8XEL6_9PSEU|nr:GDSL-type esterase/lipase family protein [Amycolatopsis sp. 2-2]WIV54047.1 GDSL-type esterase/lipase family protein [Amycolatopsis sp. 2-2]
MRTLSRPPGRRTTAALLALGLASAALLAPARTATASASAATPEPAGSAVPTAQRAEVLGAGWRDTADKAVVTSGDATGLHVLAADSADGYAWRTIATLSEPGIETDQWIGNTCVTGSGQRAVVVYAPRHFTNRDYLAERGGFVAVVDLTSGAVTKLPITTSLAYFNPGCGTGESAVLTQGGGDSLQKTRLHVLDAATAKLGTPIVVEGQVTSPVPTGRGIVAAAGNAVVSVAPSGRTTVLAEAAGVPYRMAADRDGGVVFLQSGDDRQAQARRLVFDAAGVATTTTLATGEVTSLGISAAARGAVVLTGTGTRAQSGALPGGVRVNSVARTARMSLTGAIAVTAVSPADRRDPKLTPSDRAAELPVDITATALATGKEFTLTALPTAMGGAGAELSPALSSAVAAGDPADPADAGLRTCAVPRNDPRDQAMQPKPRQVEWAVDQLVTDSLHVSRPANWKNLGMPAYSVDSAGQTDLSGGGHIPAQVLLGISLAESNMSQAAWFAVPGVTSNPLIGNYYGVEDRSGDVSQWLIDFAHADCGYGVMQITDGMKLNGQTTDDQRAMALDFVRNVLQGQRILAGKWNALHDDGVLLNGGNPAFLENWFLALWAYNSGYYPKSQASANDGAWGVGWFNNPINPRYDRGRAPFMKNPDDGRHPGDWPYPEKVLGYAGYPVQLIESPDVMVPAFRPAGWNRDDYRDSVKPPVGQFCGGMNECNPANAGTGVDPCLRADFRCWFHVSTAWKPGCTPDCGMQFIRFDPGYAYQDDGTAYPPNCGFTGLPDNARIIDDVAAAVPSVRPGCSMAYPEAGGFRFDFAGDGLGTYRGKIDVHQIGTGFRGHFWMSNTYGGSIMRASGTWSWRDPVGGWGRVLVHLPLVGARTQQARYEIDLNGDGVFDKTRYLNQEIQHNGWVSLGVYNLTGAPKLRLSNITHDGKGTERIAWDAAAVQPLPRKPQHIVAALGDSYASGEGAGGYFAESDSNHGTHRWNACRRSAGAWPRKLVLPGTGQSLGGLSDGFHPNFELGFVACSGAKTWNVTGSDGGTPVHPWSWDDPERHDTGEGQFHEIAQIDSGVLDENTTLVTLSLGGNDDNAFVNAVTECSGLGSCADDDTYLPRYKDIIDRTKTKLASTVSLIHAKAPNAKIVLMSYPELFSRTVKCAGSGYVGMPEVAALAELAGYTAAKQKEVADAARAAGAPVYAAGTIGDFVGHGGCDSVEWLHKIRIGANGEGDFHTGDKSSPFCFGFSEVACLSRESFHPNGDGTTGYATVLRRKLDEIGYP